MQKKSCHNCRHLHVKKELHQTKADKKVIKRLYCTEFHEFLHNDKPCEEYVYNTHMHKP